MSKSSSCIFFLDRCLGKHYVADALRQVGETVYIHENYFLPNTSDHHWLPVVAKKNWIILTADKNIAYRPLEIQAVKQSQAKLFVISSGNVTGPEMANIFLKALLDIKKLARNHSGPFIAKVQKNGKVSLWK